MYRLEPEIQKLENQNRTKILSKYLTALDREGGGSDCETHSVPNLCLKVDQCRCTKLTSELAGRNLF